MLSTVLHRCLPVVPAANILLLLLAVMLRVEGPAVDAAKQSLGVEVKWKLH